MEDKGEVSCLVIYSRSNELMPWKAQTPLLRRSEVVEVLTVESRVRELGEPGTQLRVVSFATRNWEPELHRTLTDRNFRAPEGIPVVSGMSLVTKLGGRLPEHLRIFSNDVVIVERR
ncbi:hypothetical protein HY477_02710 [Candidatus Uhrbacteria bacterium]|nr:hypothetical protein [Candidatus Uhrbacteria bacterium]